MMDDTPPIIAALFDLLPESDADWPIHKRSAWLQTAAASFELLYGQAGNVLIFVTPAAPQKE